MVLNQRNLLSYEYEVYEWALKFQQELMARQSSSIVSSLASSAGAGAGTELPLDPFLSGLADHQRQESADSGLGMAVSQPSYSMPHTPEDFLAGMDDRMDCTSEAGAPIDADIALGDTDDLVPSLQVNSAFVWCSSDSQ